MPLVVQRLGHTHYDYTYTRWLFLTQHDDYFRMTAAHAFERSILATRRLMASRPACDFRRALDFRLPHEAPFSPLDISLFIIHTLPPSFFYFAFTTPDYTKNLTQCYAVIPPIFAYFVYDDAADITQQHTAIQIAC